MQQQRSSNALPAFFLMLTGVWLMASGLGMDLPNASQMWPALLLMFGLTVMGQYAANRAEGLVFVGVAALLLGAFFLLFTLGIAPWSQMRLLWPTFPLIIGIAFFALFMADGLTDASLLGPAYVIGGFGLVAFPFTLGAIASPVLVGVARFWPVLLVLSLGAFFLRPSARRGRRRQVRGVRRRVQESTSALYDSDIFPDFEGEAEALPDTPAGSDLEPEA